MPSCLQINHYNNSQSSFSFSTTRNLSLKHPYVVGAGFNTQVYFISSTHIHTWVILSFEKFFWPFLRVYHFAPTADVLFLFLLPVVIFSSPSPSLLLPLCRSKYKKRSLALRRTRAQSNSLSLHTCIYLYIPRAKGGGEHRFHCARSRKASRC